MKGSLPPEEIESLKDILRVYDSDIRTGNEALDVLLKENSLHGAKEGIRFHYLGNGADLSFVNLMDVYSLFGNALENAVEAVRPLEEADRKLINIDLEKKGQMVVLHISNYYEGEVSFEDGLPLTSKTREEAFHGFGMKSMERIAEKYGGGLSATAKDGIFTLCIYLMAA